MMVACGIAACVYPIASAWMKKLRYEGEPLNEECPFIKMRHKCVYSVLYVTVALYFPYEKIFYEHSTAYRVWSICSYFALMWHYFIMRARLNCHVRKNWEATPEEVFRWGEGWLGSFEKNSVFLYFCFIVLCVGEKIDTTRRKCVFEFFVSELFFCILRMHPVDRCFGSGVEKYMCLR